MVNSSSHVIFYKLGNSFQRQGEHFSILVGTYLTLWLVSILQKILACVILFRDEITFLWI